MTQRFASPATPPPSTSAERRKALLEVKPAFDQMLSETLTVQRWPGVSAAAVLGEELLWSSGAGHRTVDGQAPVGGDTVYRIGSVTKTFTGLAVLMLRDAGKLGLDDPVVKYVPETAKLTYPTRDSSLVTLRHLITHTSGIPRIGKLDYFSRPDHDVSEQELLDGLDGLELSFSPGTKIVYSNLAMAVAGVVISRVAGMPYRDYVSQHLLVPLGMRSSVWDQQATAPQQLAAGYQKVNGKLVAQAHWRMGAAAALGGLYSSADDMGRYVAMQLSAWPPSDAPQAPGPRRSTIRESHLLAGFGRPDVQSYAANWAALQHPKLGWLVSHTGGTFGYVANVTMAPARGIGVVVMTNVGDQTLEAIGAISSLGESLLGLLAEHDPRLKMSKPLEETFRWMMDQLRKPDARDIEQRLSSDFKEAVPAKTIIELIRKVGPALGPCSSYTPIEKKGKNVMVVLLQCEIATAKLMLHVQTEAEHLINGLSIKDVVPN